MKKYFKDENLINKILKTKKELNKAITTYETHKQEYESNNTNWYIKNLDEKQQEYKDFMFQLSNKNLCKNILNKYFKNKFYIHQILNITEKYLTTIKFSECAKYEFEIELSILSPYVLVDEMTECTEEEIKYLRNSNFKYSPYITQTPSKNIIELYNNNNECFCIKDQDYNVLKNILIDNNSNESVINRFFKDKYFIYQIIGMTSEKQFITVLYHENNEFEFELYITSISAFRLISSSILECTKEEIKYLRESKFKWHSYIRRKITKEEMQNYKNFFNEYKNLLI